VANFFSEELKDRFFHALPCSGRTERVNQSKHLQQTTRNRYLQWISSRQLLYRLHERRWHTEL